MALLKRPGSRNYFYDFTVDGRRFRGSTKTAKLTEAKAREAALIVQAQERGSVPVRAYRVPTLEEISGRFLEWVRNSEGLEPNTKSYYIYGWRLLSQIRVSGTRALVKNLRLSLITKDVAGALRFVRSESETETVFYSPRYANQALTTLQRMLSKAKEWGYLRDVPTISLRKVLKRSALMKPEVESKLALALAEPIKHRRTRAMREQLRDVLICLQDSGMRPGEVFRIRIEHIDWIGGQIWNPYGKSDKARRWCVMSDRMREALLRRVDGRKEGWAFPSTRSKSGHIEGIAKGFQSLRERAGVDRKIVPYCARHTFATYGMKETRDPFTLRESMGHANIRSMEPYQHPELDNLREAINARNRAQRSGLASNTEVIQ